MTWTKTWLTIGRSIARKPPTTSMALSGSPPGDGSAYVGDLSDQAFPGPALRSTLILAASNPPSSALDAGGSQGTLVGVKGPAVYKSRGSSNWRNSFQPIPRPVLKLLNTAFNTPLYDPPDARRHSSRSSPLSTFPPTGRAAVTPTPTGRGEGRGGD